jgi:hypothetical protein
MPPTALEWPLTILVEHLNLKVNAVIDGGLFLALAAMHKGTPSGFMVSLGVVSMRKENLRISNQGVLNH